MCPHVLWDETARLYRMWYSGGEQYEPDAIGHATSPDGLKWTQSATSPYSSATPAIAWEHHKVTACQVIRQSEWFVMFYIGFRDVHHAQIGIARSRDGLTGWERHPANPIIQPGADRWDHDACYKTVRDLRWFKMAAVVQRPTRQQGTDRPGDPRTRGSRILAISPAQCRRAEHIEFVFTTSTAPGWDARATGWLPRRR